MTGALAHLVTEGLDLTVGALHDGRVRIPVVIIRVNLHVQRQTLPHERERTRQSAGVNISQIRNELSTVRTINYTRKNMK